MTLPVQDPRQRAAYHLASEDIGLTEIKGPIHEKRIVDMARLTGITWINDDETPWCATAMGAWLTEAGLPSTRSARAKSYLEWGEEIPLHLAKPGDIVVYDRPPNPAHGHVNFFHRREGNVIYGLGGNQKNSVNIAPYPISRVVSVRRWPTEAPRNVDPITRLLNAIFGKIFRGGTSA